MIKINLLPKGINEKRATRNTAIMFGIGLVALIAAILFYNYTVLIPAIRDMEAKASAAEKLQTEVQELQAKAQATLDSITPMQAKLDFISAVLKYNTEYPKLYREVSKWTYEKVVLSSMACDGSGITMQARVKSLEDLGRYLLNMYRATDLYTQVSITGIPGYGGGGSSSGGASGAGPMAAAGPRMGGAPGMRGPGAGGGVGMGAIGGSLGRVSGETNWIDFTVSCTLKNPIVPPTFNEAAASTSTAAGMGAADGGGMAGAQGAVGGARPGANRMGAVGGARPGANRMGAVGGARPGANRMGAVGGARPGANRMGGAAGN